MTNRIDREIDDMFKLLEMMDEHQRRTISCFVNYCPEYRIEGSLYCDKHQGTTIYGPRVEDVPADKRDTPYPWCAGNPTRQDCIEAGYCRRDPNCGE